MKPFTIEISTDQVEDLRRRLADARWPELPAADAGSWDRGVSLDALREAVTAWQAFDWHAVEDRLNELPQFMTTIDGADVHLVHATSPHETATPLLLLHGWPTSFAEFADVVDRLTDPTRFGGSAEDAFHVVIPSLPGFGFSPRGGQTFPIPRIAAMMSGLMAELGYDSYLVHGGDVGAWIAQTVAAMDPAVRGVHVSFLVTPPPPDADPALTSQLDPEDLRRLGLLSGFLATGSGYMSLQATKPQTVAAALTASPVAQLAWMLEKYHDWADTEAGGLTTEQVLTQASIYWFTGTAASSAQFYFDNAAVMPTSGPPSDPPPPLDRPLGVSSFRNDPAPPVRAFAGGIATDIVHWSEHDQGGHFGALEAPEELSADLRTFARTLRERG